LLSLSISLTLFLNVAEERQALIGCGGCSQRQRQQCSNVWRDAGNMAYQPKYGYPAGLSWLAQLAQPRGNAKRRRK
jgi:hypothetical protein